MDNLDRKILNIIQSNFPLECQPFAAVGIGLELPEAEVLARVRALKEKGIIRRLGASFQSKKLGWHSTLCAAKVPEENIETFVAAVNALPGVTHNYLRENEHNVWFTYIGPSWEAVCTVLDSITAQTGIPIRNLPAEKMFKIKVDFRIDDDV